MKRLIALSLSLCMVGTMLAACSSSQDTAQEDGPVTITIWHDKEDEVAAALQAELDQLADRKSTRLNSSHVF